MSPTNPDDKFSVFKLLTDNLVPMAVVGFTAVVLAIGWHLFARRLDDRSERTWGENGEVARIWGGALLQPHPQVRWRRADAATVELARGEISKTDANVDLGIQYRRRGVTEYPCYDAAFEATYEFRNPTPESAFVAFTLGLPVERDALMLQEIRLLVDEHEDAAATEYSSERIAWTGRVAGGATARFKVLYKARGMSRFGYTFGSTRFSSEQPGRPVTAFRLALNVRGARGALDYPVGSMSPTTVETVGDAAVLVWNVDRLLSAFDVGVELPDSRGQSAALAKLTRNAPVFYLMYAAGLLYAFARLGRRGRLLHALGLSFAYFLYFPLAAYLTAYLPWAIAAVLALGAISGLAIVHAWRFTGLRTTVLVGLDQLFFLAAPAAAYLLPAHTGLILVIAGFAALAVGLQIVGAAARERTDEPRETVHATTLVGGQP